MSQIIRLNDQRQVAIRLFSERDKEGVAKMFAAMSEEALRWAMPPYTRERLERGWWSDLERLIAIVAENERCVVGYAQVSRSALPRRKGIGELLIYIH